MRDSSPTHRRAGLWSLFPISLGAVTQGETEAEAMEMGLDAITLVINELMKRGEPIPQPRKRHRRKHRVIYLTAHDEAQVELYRSRQVATTQT
jgi:predicted RNase H-like HicB family nuclease